MKVKVKSRREGTLEPLPTTKPGNRVLRVIRKRPGIFHAIRRNIVRLFKRMVSQ